MNEQGQMLSSWKEIAAYLQRTVRTCQRLEMGMGLPIHRLDGSSKAHVFAYPHELDAWLAKKVDEHEQRRSRWRRFLYPSAALAVIVSAIILINVLGGRKTSRDAVPAPGIKSVAVLPFDDLSLQTGHEQIADGITESLTSNLSRIHGLLVTGRISAAAVKDQKLGIREIGQALNVKNLLTGSVQVTGERLHVTVGLVDIATGFQSWSRNYDRQMGDFLDIQEEISMSIVEQLGVELLAGEESSLLKRPTSDTQALDLYLRGRYVLAKPKIDAPQEALRLFEEALHRDPKFALAYVGIAGVYMNMISLFLIPPTVAGPKAESAVERALALDPDLAEAHALNAWVQFLYNYRWDAAGKSFQRALELKPGDAMTRGMYAYFLMTRKRFKDARAEITRALASDRLMPMLSAYSMWIHLYTGRNKEVLEEFQKVQQIDPNFEFAYFGAGMAYLNLGRVDESVEMFKKGCSLPHDNMRPEAGLAVAYLKKGDRKAAEALYGKLLEGWEKNRAGSPVNLAWVAAALGHIDAAFDFLDTAIREHEPDIPAIQIYAEAVLPDIARQPRFLAILDTLHLPH